MVVIMVRIQGPVFCIHKSLFLLLEYIFVTIPMWSGRSKNHYPPVCTWKQSGFECETLPQHYLLVLGRSYIFDLSADLRAFNHLLSFAILVADECQPQLLFPSERRISDRLSRLLLPFPLSQKFGEKNKES
jgi:hypothetical protein